MKLKHQTQNRKGASSVEFALVFPITLTFFISMIGLTQIFLLHDTAQHAAYEGVRHGLNITSTRAEVQEAVEDFNQTMGIKNATIFIQPDTFDSSTSEVRVGVSIPLNTNAWISVPFMPADWEVSSEITLSRRND